MNEYEVCQIKVYSSECKRDGRAVPTLHLCGRWMTELGFREEDQIKVTLRAGLMIIEIAEDEDARERVKFYRGILKKAIEELQAIRKL